MTSFNQMVSFELPYIIVCILLVCFWTSIILSLFVFYKFIQYTDVQDYFNLEILKKQHTLELQLQDIEKIPNKKTD